MLEITLTDKCCDVPLAPCDAPQSGLSMSIDNPQLLRYATIIETSLSSIPPCTYASPYSPESDA